MVSLRAAAVSPVIVFVLAAMSANAAERVTAGFGYVPPLHYRDSQGRATGFVVDVLNEAARREHLQISWLHIGGSNHIERALADGTIDLFPAGIVTERRRSRFSISEPWWSEDISVLARTDKGIASATDLENRRVALTTPAYEAMAAQTLPGARLFVPEDYDTRGGPSVSASLVCTGRADGAVMAHLEVDEVLMDRPQECQGLKLQMLETPGALDLAVITRRDKTALGTRLRRRIDELALDGTLGHIASQYPRIPARSAVELAETVRARYEQRSLWTALAGAGLLVVIGSFLLIRQLRTQRALRRSLAAQAKTELALRSRTEELTASNEELQVFAYSVSHDLQEPLRMISLYAELFQRRFPPESDDGRLYLGFLRDGASRMQEMVSNLLVYSRIGRRDSPQTMVDIAAILASVLRDLDYQTRTTSAEIIVRDMPSVPGWPDRLNVLFQNLISNALKYHRKDVTPRIEILAEDCGEYWRFAVRDNGIGFKPEYAERIFDAFKRLHGRDEYGGTGLGLAIARRVVERHGGRIWAEGRLNEGSTFFFTLPARPAPVPGEEQRSVKYPAAAETI